MQAPPFQIPFVLSQFGYQIPMFVVYVFAAILALRYREIAPLASALTLLSVGILAVTNIGFAVMQTALIQMRPQDMASRMMIIGMAANILRALGFGILAAAVFVERKPHRPDESNEELPPLWQ